MKRSTYLLLAACCSLLAAHAEPPALRWIVDPSRPAPADWVVFQGETVTLEPSFVAYGATLPLTNCTAALYWQTNGMGQAWWSVPAEIVTSAAPRVRATWSPTNDIGARAYTYFVGLGAPGGIGYRAHGRLMMRAAPGAIPALLGPPTTLTDAMQAWADARYDPLGAAQGVSNTLAGALQSEAQARAAGDALARTNWQAIVYGMTNGAVLGATALQPSWAPTGHVGTADFAAAAETAAAADWAAEATYAADAGQADDLMQGGLAEQRIAAGNIPMRRMQMWDWGWSTNRWLVLTNDVIEIWEQ